MTMEQNIMDVRRLTKLVTKLPRLSRNLVTDQAREKRLALHHITPEWPGIVIHMQQMKPDPSPITKFSGYSMRTGWKTIQTTWEV